jgi:hypothetical protein
LLFLVAPEKLTTIRSPISYEELESESFGAAWLDATNTMANKKTEAAGL